MAQRDLRKVRVEAGKVAAATRRLRDAIIHANQSGETVRDIAPYADMSPAKVQQILVDWRRTQEPA
jgi:uncharacterized protein (DUF111 family)